MQSGHNEYHSRSQTTIRTLKENGYPILHKILKDGTAAYYINLSGIFYRIIDGYVDNFTKELLVSVGGSIRREHLVLYPQSQILQQKYNLLKQNIVSQWDNAIHRDQQIEMALTLAMNYARSADNFKILKEIEVNVDPINDTNPRGTQQKPVMAIDYFLEKNTGVCRHLALFLAYLLDRLKQDGLLPPGEIILRRDNIERGAHAWVLYRADHMDDFYLVDSTWNKKPFLALRDQKFLVDRGYGKKTIDKFTVLFNERLKSRLLTVFSKLRELINNEFPRAHYAYSTCFEDNKHNLKLHFAMDYNDVATRIAKFLSSKGLKGLTLEFIPVPGRVIGAAVITIDAAAAKAFTNDFGPQEILKKSEQARQRF